MNHSWVIKNFLTVAGIVLYFLGKCGLKEGRHANNSFSGDMLPAFDSLSGSQVSYIDGFSRTSNESND